MRCRFHFVSLVLPAKNIPQFHDNLSIARGNIALADHGRTIAGELLGEVPLSQILLPPDSAPIAVTVLRRNILCPRFRPSLSAKTDYTSDTLGFHAACFSEFGG